MIVDVVLKNKIKSADQLWYYTPQAIPVGCRVKVMLNSQTLIGLVIDCIEDRATSFELKPILEVLDDTPVLSPLFLRLFDYAQTISLDTKYEILQQCLPIDKRLNESTVEPFKERKYIRTERLISESKLRKINEILEYKSGEIIDHSLISSQRLRSFIKAELLEVVEDLPSYITQEKAIQPPLNQEQREVVNAINLDDHQEIGRAHV